MMDGDGVTLRALRELEARDLLAVRMQASMWVKPERGEQDIEEILELDNQHGMRWRGGLAKFLIDEVVKSGIAWLYEPDMHRPGQHPARPISRPTVARPPLPAAGCACATHAVGDKARGAQPGTGRVR